MRWELEYHTENKKIWLKVAHSIVIVCAFSAINIYPLVLKEQRPKEKEVAHHRDVRERDFGAWFGSIMSCSLLPSLYCQTAIWGDLTY